MRRIPVFVLMTLGVLPGTIARAACPTNYASSGRYDFYPTEPTWAYGSPDGPSYDLPAGRVHSRWGGASETGNSFSLIVHDDYWIEGPAGSTPIPITARLHVTGVAIGGTRGLPPYGCSYARLSAELAFDAQHVGTSAEAACADVPVDEVLSVSLSRVVGEIFQLTISVATGAASSHASVDGVLTFDDLPAGYSIRSCQGFANAPTPTRSASWGSLKAAYR